MNQTESEELRKLISDRFDQSDRQLEARINEIKIEIVKVEAKLSREIVKVKSDLSQEINQLDFKLSQEINAVDSKLSQEIVKIKVDTTWIKWLFGGLLSAILILLSIIITLLFKLVEIR